MPIIVVLPKIDWLKCPFRDDIHNFSNFVVIIRSLN